MKIRNIETRISFRIISIFSNTEADNFIHFLKKEYDSYIFGGLIKDFVFGNDGIHRDIDIVVNEVDEKFKNYIAKYKFFENQFGGFKIFIGNFEFDIWDFNKTWAVKKYPLLSFTTIPEYLPYTSFFNITAVLFSLKDDKLIYNSEFTKFLEDKVLSIVLEDNPFPELCIIKTYEYIKKYDLKLSKKLINYFIKNYSIKRDKLNYIQKKHYSEIKFPQDELDDFYYRLISKSRKNMISSKKKRNYQLELPLFY